MINNVHCPFCWGKRAYVTYEENRLYKLTCPECGGNILRKDKSLSAAVTFFGGMRIWTPAAPGADSCQVFSPDDIPLNSKHALSSLLGDSSCHGLEAVGACPDRRLGDCRYISNLPICAINLLAERLIEAGLMVRSDSGVQNES